MKRRFKTFCSVPDGTVVVLGLQISTHVSSLWDGGL